MIHTYSHTFKFETTDNSNSNENYKNTLSIVEEDVKKHYAHYIQYKYINKNEITYREIDINLDRLYYLEIANIAIDDEERRKRLFTLLGKRCFGRNDNKIDLYLLDKTINPIEIVLECKDKQSPILFEISSHNLNKFEAHLFTTNDNNFVTLKQTNISNRKVFKKTFLVQLTKDEYTKLISYRTSELKINFIFNAIGKIFFKSQELRKTSISDINIESDSIFDNICQNKNTITKQKYLDINLFNNLRSKQRKIETEYFKILSKGMQLTNYPDDEDVIFMFSSAVSNYINLLQEEKQLTGIVTLLKSINTLAQDKKLSYLMAKNDYDIKDIFLFLLEAMTAWNASLDSDELKVFNTSTLDLHNALKYFIDIYMKHYYAYKCMDNITKVEEKAPIELLSVDTVQKISATEYFNDIELDYSILDELKELETDVENAIYIEELNGNIKDALIKFFDGYITMLNTFYEFKELAYALSLLTKQLGDFDINHNSSLLMVFLKGIIKDLIDWKYSVFIVQDSEDIHYIDKSFYANIAQLDLLFNEDNNSESEMEFF